MKLIGTHSGAMHADDALGASILLAVYPGATVVRSRSPEVWSTCDALVDVGGEHDPGRNRYDHHQPNFDGRRPDGIPYAAAGLVWDAYGVRYVLSNIPHTSFKEAAYIAREVDARLIQHVDAVDSGISVPGPAHFSLSGIIETMNATWLDAELREDERFAEAVSIAGAVLRNLVRAVAAELAAADRVRSAQKRSAGRVLVLDVARLPFDPVVCGEMPEVLFVAYPEAKGQEFHVRVVRAELGSFAARADLPAAWAGLRDAELAKVTGVPDALFCHNGRFICGATSMAGAVRLAELAVAAL